MNKIRLALALCALVASNSLLSAADFETIHLWTNGAPGFEDRRNEPEQAQSYWVKNINNPSITVFLPPKEKANGAAVLIFPGGGHRELVFQAESPHLRARRPRIQHGQPLQTQDDPRLAGAIDRLALR